MGIEDLAGQAQGFLASDEVQSALKSSQAEGVSDGVLDKLEQAVDDATGGKFHDQISGARDAIDHAVGDQ